MVAGSAPVVKLRGGPFTVLPAVSVWENMLYLVWGYMPATSNVMVAGGWQFTQFVVVGTAFRDCGENQGRMELPAPHEVALNNAPRGLSIGTATGVLPRT